MGRGPAWTEGETKFLKDNKFLSNEVVADKLGRSVSSVRNAKKKITPDAVSGSWKCVPWSEQDRQTVAENRKTSERELSVLVGRSVQSVRNERLRQRRESGLPVKVPKLEVPEQDLWDRPPGLYVEVIGRLLIEDEECMDSWMHAHGFSSFEIVHEDPRGWYTLTCAKVS